MHIMQFQNAISNLVLLSVLFALNTNGYKILVYIPRAVDSQIEYMGHLADTLVEAGHDVVIIKFTRYRHEFVELYL